MNAVVWVTLPAVCYFHFRLSLSWIGRGEGGGGGEVEGPWLFSQKNSKMPRPTPPIKNVPSFKIEKSSMIVIDFAVDVSTRWFETNVLRHQNSELDKRSFPTALSLFLLTFYTCPQFIKGFRSFHLPLSTVSQGLYGTTLEWLFLHNTLIQIVFLLAVEYTNLAGERHNLMFIERRHYVTLPW